MGEVFRGSEALSDGALTEYQLRQWYRPNHRSDRRRFVKDIDKLGVAEDQGWIVIRVVSEHRPRAIVSRVYRALARRGWHPDRRQRAALSRFLALPSISA